MLVLPSAAAHFCKFKRHASLKGCPGWGRPTVNLAGLCTSPAKAILVWRLPRGSGSQRQRSCSGPSSSLTSNHLSFSLELQCPARPCQSGPGTRSLLSLTQWEGQQGATFLLRQWFPRCWLGCQVKAYWFSSFLPAPSFFHPFTPVPLSGGWWDEECEFHGLFWPAELLVAASLPRIYVKDTVSGRGSFRGTTCCQGKNLPENKVKTEENRAHRLRGTVDTSNPSDSDGPSFAEDDNSDLQPRNCSSAFVFSHEEAEVGFFVTCQWKSPAWLSPGLRLWDVREWRAEMSWWYREDTDKREHSRNWTHHFGFCRLFCCWVFVFVFTVPCPFITILSLCFKMNGYLTHNPKHS